MKSREERRKELLIEIAEQVVVCIIIISLMIPVVLYFVNEKKQTDTVNMAISDMIEPETTAN